MLVHCKSYGIFGYKFSDTLYLLTLISHLMKKIFFSLLSLFFLFSCTGIEQESEMKGDSSLDVIQKDKYFIQQDQALRIAEDFFRSNMRTTNSSPRLLGTDGTLLGASAPQHELPAYYVYGMSDKAFVIVSATEAAFPILGYSFENSFDTRDIPVNLKGMLSQYSREIRYLRQNEIEPSAEVRALRAKDPIGEIVVDEIMKGIYWTQSPYYNAYCPPGTPVGCVATATSMIMRYWEYPESGVGSHSYFHSRYGLLEADFNHKYNWSKMPKGKLTGPNHDVALFSYDVAVAVEMNFAPGGSGTYQTIVPGVLKKFFRYPDVVTNATRNDYTEAEWDKLIKNELDHKRPVQYAGSGQGGGHSFVCDGYDSKSYFHINWGWGGSSNGWFKLNALDPSELGTGGGTGGFNYYQYAVINFMPPATVAGDNNNPIGGDEPEGETMVVYADVKAYSSKPLYIRYTQFNGVETFSHGDGYQKFLKKLITVGADRKLNFAVSAEIVDPTLADQAPYIGIWIDLNRDGQFDEKTELISSAQKQMVNGEFVLPATLKAGTYRLRAIVRKEMMPNPNKSFLYGEIEDYTITLK